MSNGSQLSSQNPILILSSSLSTISTSVTTQPNIPIIPILPVQCDDSSLLGTLGLIVQFLLAFTAFCVLIVKRACEPWTKRRPWKIWLFDTSKQAIAATLIHFINIFLSSLYPGDACVWYVTNFLLDSTFGLLFIYVSLRALVYLANETRAPSLFAALLRRLHVPQPWISAVPGAEGVREFRFGDYGPSISMADSRAPEMLAEEDLACCACDACPRTAHVLCFCSGPRGRRWAFQTALYLLIVLVEKLITALFLMLPFWSAVNRVLMLIIPIPSLRVVFVLLIIPLVVNAINFWVIDMFLMKPLESTSRSGTGIGDGLSGEPSGGGEDLRVEYTTAVDGASVIPYSLAVRTNPSQSGGDPGAQGKPRGGSILTLMQPTAAYSPYGTTASPESTPTHTNGASAGAGSGRKAGDGSASGMASFQAGIGRDDRPPATYNYR